MSTSAKVPKVVKKSDEERDSAAPPLRTLTSCPGSVAWIRDNGVLSPIPGCSKFCMYNHHNIMTHPIGRGCKADIVNYDPRTGAPRDIVRGPIGSHEGRVPVTDDGNPRHSKKNTLKAPPLPKPSTEAIDMPQLSEMTIYMIVLIFIAAGSIMPHITMLDCLSNFGGDIINLFIYYLFFFELFYFFF